jgi:hypothetical protein
LWKTKNMNLGGGEAKFYVLFYGDNSWTVAPEQTMFGAVKYQEHRRTCKFYLNRYILRKLVNMMLVQNFQVMLGQTLNHSV